MRSRGAEGCRGGVGKGVALGVGPCDEQPEIKPERHVWTDLKESCHPFKELGSQERLEEEKYDGVTCVP